MKINLVNKCKKCHFEMPKKSKHHFYCDKCWLKNKQKVCLEEIDITKKIKPLKFIR